MTPKVQVRFGGYGTEIDFKGFDFNGAPDADIAAARAILDEANALCPKPVAAKAVAVLKARTKSRAEQGDDLKLLIAVFSDDLQRYPADVVIAACRAWGENEMWFPSWSELKGVCESKFQRRRALQEILS